MAEFKWTIITQMGKEGDRDVMYVKVNVFTKNICESNICNYNYT